MKIKLRQIPQEGLRIEGDEPPSVMDLRDPLYRFEQPIHYALEVTPVEGRGISVRGGLSTVARACCVRTLEWFDLPLVVENFQYHSGQVRGDEIDLTPEIREDILLALPSSPVSPQAQPLEAGKHDQARVQNGVWGKLDQLKLTKKGIKN